MAVRRFTPFAAELGGIPLEETNPPVITPVFLGNFQPQCASCTSDFPVTNGPVTWSIVSGALPTGFVLQDGFDPDTGMICGTAVDADVGTTASFTIRATNADGFDDWTTSLTIAAWIAPNIDETSPPASPAAAGDFYDSPIFDEANIQCSDWTIVAGSLPPGLTLVTGFEFAEITGTPTTGGTYNFTIREENGAGFDEESFEIVITGGGDGTATPAAIALIAVVPAPTASGTSPGTASPAAVARTAVVPAPTTSGSSSTTPAAIARTVVTPAPTVLARPANDNFADAILLSNGIRVTKARDDATAEVGETGSATLWWKFVTTDAGPVSVNTIGSTYDTILRVYTGASIGALTLIASDDDSGGSFTSLVSFAGLAATTYYVQVSNGAFSFIGSQISVQATYPVPSIPLSVVVPAPTALGGSGGDAFATPAAIVLNATTPPPVSPNGNATPAAVALTVVVPAPTVTEIFPAMPATIALTAVVPAPTATGTVGAVLAATWGPMTGVTVASVSSRIEAVLAALW